MPYSLKDYQELLEIMRSQDVVISNQNRTIERLTLKVLELENFISVAEIEYTETKQPT